MSHDNNNMLNAKVKKFCISLLESAGSFAYTRGVMGELDTSIRSWFISSLFPSLYNASLVDLNSIALKSRGTH